MSNAGYGNHEAPPPGGSHSGSKKPIPDPIRGGEAAEPPAPSGDGVPTAGPHADPALINPDATPGTGTLPSPGEQDNIDSTSG
ncbi:MAG: hypothetical protein AVDCRST_MAG90-3207 [uncultured Microvirga sp.]|uniref:Uncharacterized protein n=1 Tax=uncultured Microvirga sp. TaxID=412392 RepID=A0A6J4MT48_9HYPH|nr:MAG: hypothetical protein AVDCRST_MAG90-3207 [uncultured Microvirga sp.]